MPVCACILAGWGMVSQKAQWAYESPENPRDLDWTWAVAYSFDVLLK